MNIADRLKGAFTALVTPFDADDNVDVAALKRIVSKQLEQGISGLVPCGTTGETPCLSADEQETVVRTAVELADGKVPVIAGTGSNSTKVTIEQTNRAKAWGIDAALVVCPYYNKPTQEGLFQHFKAVWEACGVPVVLYNVPGRTVSDIQPDTLARLVEIGAIVAIKDATANLQRAAEQITATGGKLALLSGDDFTILPFVATGGQGVISVVSNIAPRDTVRLVAASAEGDLAAARPLNGRIVELSKSLFLQSNPIPIKAMVAMAGFCHPRVRSPLVTADEALMKKLRVALDTYRGATDDASLEGFMA
ncbi:MAG: 4-hydroxy-tetrahydrodipicolinate synthase [Deltaproteobacteria bacterium]|jgi:4-hydroxy-tetrahydrodipicolinate synthase